MKIKITLVVISMIALLLGFGTFVVSAQEEPDFVRLEISNRSDQPVAISLISETNVYYLPVSAESEKLFTVERGVYTHTTYACGLSASGTIDLTSQMKLVFTRCYGKAPNWGEPSLEKIHIDDSPNGKNWRYSFD